MRNLMPLLLTSLILAHSSASANLARECSGIDVSVEVTRAEQAERICKVSEQAIEHLGFCGLSQDRPFSITLKEDLPVMEPKCFATADCRKGHIEIASEDAIASHVGADDPYSAIPTPELFDSILVHEITHVLAFQTRGGPPTTRVEEEYIAYAMQLDFLSNQSRQAFLDRHEMDLPVAIEEFNALILDLSPTLFSAYAWSHFSENGCEMVRKILRGEAVFPDFFPL